MAKGRKAPQPRHKCAPRQQRSRNDILRDLQAKATSAQAPVPSPSLGPTTIPYSSDESGEWIDVASEPIGLDGRLLHMGPPGRYKVTLYAGSTLPEWQRANKLITPAPSLLRLPGAITFGVGHPRDRGSSPHVVFTPDARGLLDTIDVIIERQHLDRQLIRTHPLVDETQKSGHDIGEQIAAEEEAVRRAATGLNWFSFLKRIPLAIHSIMSQDLASGHVHSRLRLPFVPVSLQMTELFEGAMQDDFAKAFGLYREALCTDNPFYRFLSLFKIWELIDGTTGYEGLRPRLCKELKAAGLYPGRPEERFKVGPYRDHPYREILNNELRDIRDAVAHAILESGAAHHPDDLADIRRVADAGSQLHLAVRDILMHECEAFQRLVQGQRHKATVISTPGDGATEADGACLHGTQQHDGPRTVSQG